MTSGVYVLSCRLASGPFCLGIYPFLWWFLLVIFGLFLLHWRSELPCQDKLPEFHCTPILGCIRVLWLVFHPLGLGLDKALCGWNSVTEDSGKEYFRSALESTSFDFCFFCEFTLSSHQVHIIAHFWFCTFSRQGILQFCVNNIRCVCVVCVLCVCCVCCVGCSMIVGWDSCVPTCVTVSLALMGGLKAHQRPQKV